MELPSNIPVTAPTVGGQVNLSESKLEEGTTYRSSFHVLRKPR